MRLISTMLVLALAACGGGDPSPAVDAPLPDSPDPGGWVVLVSGDWTLAPGTEDMQRAHRTLDQDLYVRAIRPLAPPGTHHTVLTRYTGSHADGTVRCSVGTNGQSMIYGSGVGSPEQALSLWQSSPGHNEVILNQGIWADLPWGALGADIHQGFAVLWFGAEADPAP